MELKKREYQQDFLVNSAISTAIRKPANTDELQADAETPCAPHLLPRAMEKCC